MATVSYTATNAVGGVKLIAWTPMVSANLDGYPFVCAQYADKAVQVYGSFGGASVTFQGSNDYSNGSETWATLHDPQGNAATLASAGVLQLLENTYKVRPLVSGATGGTSLTIVLAASTPTANSDFIPNSP